MSTSNSGLMANTKASPPTANAPSVQGGRVRSIQNVFEIAATSDIAAADIIRLCPLPANANLRTLEIFTDDLGTSLTLDIGLYTTADVVKDVDAYASAYEAGTATTAWTDVRYEAASIDDAADLVYENAGDSDASEGQYWLCATVVTSTAPAVGTVGFRLTYTVD